jgi:hypothetical protein
MARIVIAHPDATEANPWKPVSGTTNQYAASGTFQLDRQSDIPTIECRIAYDGPTSTDNDVVAATIDGNNWKATFVGPSKATTSAILTALLFVGGTLVHVASRDVKFP